MYLHSLQKYPSHSFIFTLTSSSIYQLYACEISSNFPLEISPRCAKRTNESNAGGYLGRHLRELWYPTNSPASFRYDRREFVTSALAPLFPRETKWTLVQLCTVSSLRRVSIYEGVVNYYSYCGSGEKTSNATPS